MCCLVIGMNNHHTNRILDLDTDVSIVVSPRRGLTFELPSNQTHSRFHSDALEWIGCQSKPFSSTTDHHHDHVCTDDHHSQERLQHPSSQDPGCQAGNHRKPPRWWLLLHSPGEGDRQVWCQTVHKRQWPQLPIVTDSTWLYRFEILIIFTIQTHDNNSHDYP